MMKKQDQTIVKYSKWVNNLKSLDLPLKLFHKKLKKLVY